MAGFHSNGLIVTKLARSFGDEGMLAYVRDIQRQEKVEEVELLKHQKWSGAELVDKMVNVASGGGKREFRLAAELKGMATLSWKISHLEGQWSV